MRLPDGTDLHTHTWPVPAGIARRGSLVLVHGLGEHSGRYARVAEELAATGLEVHGYDLRGHGRSGGARGALPRPDALLDDLAIVFSGVERDARAGGDANPPFLLGHSLGGAIAARATSGGWVRPRGLVLSSPALALSVSPLQRLAAFIGRRLIPDRAVPNALDADGLSHDPAVVAAYRADELVHDRITARLYDFISGAGAATRRDAGAIAVPTLLLVAGTDRLVDASGSRALAAGLSDGLGTLHVYAEAFHELFNEPDPVRARVMADLKAWLAATA
jgi:alpha-beta hydrolase superfamily lysophospholipase